jgi:hypothetical protein
MAGIEEQVDPRVAELRVALLVGLDRTDERSVDDDRVDLYVLVLARKFPLDPSQVEGGPPSGDLGRRQDRRQGRRVGVGRRAEDDPSAAEFHRRSVARPRPQAVPLTQESPDGYLARRRARGVGRCRRRVTHAVRRASVGAVRAARIAG